MGTILEIPEAAKKVIQAYSKLKIGNEEVITPYFMNLAKVRGGLRVLVGKGTAEEIIREVKVVAHLKGIDLTKLNVSELRQLMVDNNIGIDCSGFLVYLFNAWLKSQGDLPLINYLKFDNKALFNTIKRKLRPVENIGAELMTNLENCDPVINFDDIKPGDLIRSKGKQKNSHHVSLVSKVFLDNNKVTAFEYVHSMRYYDDEHGIRSGKVVITNSQGELKDQDWQEVKNGKNYTYEGLLKDYQDNGIRRLKRAPLKFDAIST